MSDETKQSGSRDHLHGVVAALQPVVQGVREDHMDAPTPCADWRVRDLVNHLLGTSEAMRRIGADEEADPDDPWGTKGDHLGPDWRDDLSDRLTGLASAWADEEAWVGEMPGGGMPKQAVGDMAYVEVMLHGSDLARATGQELAWDESAVERARAVLDEIGPMGREQGAFGEEVAVPDAADPWDEVLGLAGRDPGWSAG